jgi:uncharacterized protein (UPF0332 family)
LASFDEHLNQAKKKLFFLEQINLHCKDFYDWQVTVCFYSCLHLVNAHLSTFNLEYRKHKDVKDALNPFSMSPAKLPEDEYSAYISLQSLSRRSRYLVNEKDDNLNSGKCFLTYEKHLEKSLRHLDKIATYFTGRYKLELGTFKIDCAVLNYSQFKFVKK